MAELIKVFWQFDLWLGQCLGQWIAPILEMIGDSSVETERQNDCVLPIDDPDHVVGSIHQDIVR